jgi:AraC-like DNA-binding protein
LSLFPRDTSLACIGLAAANCLGTIGCGVSAQPDSARTVAAFEVPLPSETDRDQFLSVLRTVAATEGMHVDASSSEELKREGDVSQAFKKTMNATVWRGANDDEAFASAMDEPDHLGEVWISFFKGKDPTLNSRLRESAMREIMLHEYVKGRRLIAARHDLMRCQSLGLSVSRVALDYGFSHLGLFAKSYCNLFGELPSDTLRSHRT